MLLALLLFTSISVYAQIEDLGDNYYADKYWYNAEFNKFASEYPLVKLVPKENNIASLNERIIIHPVNMLYYNGLLEEVISNVRSVNATVNGTVIKYINAYTTSTDVLDMEFIYNPIQLKENLYLKNKNFSEPSINGTIYLTFKNRIEYNKNIFDLYADGIKKSEDFDGAEILELKRNTDNKTIWKFNKIDATDSNNASINGTYKVVFKNYGLELSMKISWDWINDPNRVFPIIIDPTLEVNATSTEDIKLDANNPDANYEGLNLSVGNSTLSYLKFNLSEYNFDTINYATLNLYVIENVSNNVNFTITVYYGDNDIWDENITYNTQPIENWAFQSQGNYTVNNGTSVINRGWIRLDVLDAVIDSWNGDKVLTLMVNSTSPNTIYFYDTEYTEYKPYLYIHDPVDCSSYCTEYSTYWECTGTMTCNYLDTSKNIWIYDATINGYGGTAEDGLIRMNSTDGWVNISNSVLNGYGGDGTNIVGADGGKGLVFILADGIIKIYDSNISGNGGDGGDGNNGNISLISFNSYIDLFNSTLDGYGGNGLDKAGRFNAGNGYIKTESINLMINKTTLNAYGGTAPYGSGSPGDGGDGYLELNINNNTEIYSSILNSYGGNGTSYADGGGAGDGGDGTAFINTTYLKLDNVNISSQGGQVGRISSDGASWLYSGSGNITINSIESLYIIGGSNLYAFGKDNDNSEGSAPGSAGSGFLSLTSSEINITTNDIIRLDAHGGGGKSSIPDGNGTIIIDTNSLITSGSVYFNSNAGRAYLEGTSANSYGKIESVSEITFKETASISGRDPAEGYNILNITSSSPKLGLFNTSIPYRYYVYCGGPLTVGRSGRTDQNLTFDSSCLPITNVTYEEYFAPPVNQVPTIVSVNTQVSYDPIENSVTPINISFIANDNDGVSDLNDSSAQIYVWKDSVNHTSTSCSASDLNTTATNYTCTINMDYYDSPGTWNINASVSDNNGSLVYNDTETFTYNSLKAMLIANKPISFGNIQINIGTISNNISIKNVGNVIFNVNATGSNLTYNSYSIPADDIKWDTDSNPSDGTTLTESSQQVLANLNGGDIYYIWHYILVDELDLISGTYSGTFIYNAI